MANIPVQVEISAVDRASDKFKQVGSSMERLGDAFRRGGLMATGFLATLGVAGTQMLKIAGDIEQNRIAFETMTGSAEEAMILLQDVSDFAIKTPFDLPGVVQGARQLMAMGASTEQVIPELKMLGDVAAGLGVDLNRVILNFGQVRTQGKLTGRELRDFAILGVPLIDELAQSLGVAKTEIAEMVSAGEIGFPEVQAAFERMAGEGGKFENLMEKQAKSLKGIFENIRDQMVRTVAQIAGISVTGEIREGSFFDVTKKGAEALLEALNKLTPQLVKFSDWFTSNKTLVVALAGAIGGLLVVAVGGLLVTLAGGVGVLAAFISIGAVAAVMIYNIYKSVVEAKDAIEQYWIPAFNKAKEIVNTTISAITTAFQEFITKIGEFMQSLTLENIVYWITYAMGFMVSSIANGIVNAIGLFMQLPGAVADIFTNLLNHVVSKVSSLWAWISNEVSQWPYRFAGFLRSLPGMIADILQRLVNTIQDKLLGGALSKIMYFKDRVVGAFNSVRDAIQGAINKAREGFASGISAGGGIPHFQTGGIVPGRLGEPQLIMAHGGETVLPVGGGTPAVAGANAGGGTTNLSLSVNVGIYAGTNNEKRQLAMDLWEEVGRLARSHNKTPQELLGYKK